MPTYKELVDELFIKLCEGTVEISDELLDDFTASCRQVIVKHFTTERDNTFRLRMSNIGKDIRSLHLDKLYGINPPSPDSKVRFIYGDLMEAMWIFILKLAGIKVIGEQQQVQLDISGEKIEGTYDLIVQHPETGELEVIDIKTTSYLDKFKSIDTLEENDGFGYIPQLFGYAEATKVRAGGFLVFDKKHGAMHLLDIPIDVYNRVKQSALNKIKEVVEHFKYNKEIPPCPGFVDEIFNGKPTGRKVLSDKCKFCSHKDKCHPGIVAEPCRSSKAKVKPIKYYEK